MKLAIIAAATLVCGGVAFAQCDVTLPRAQYITCLSSQQQQQTGNYPHPSTFQSPQQLYQQPVPVYQAPAPIYPQPPALWAPVDRSSSYR